MKDANSKKPRSDKLDVKKSKKRPEKLKKRERNKEEKRQKVPTETDGIVSPGDKMVPGLTLLNSPSLIAFSTEEMETYRSRKNIKVVLNSSGTDYPPVREFSEMSKVMPKGLLKYCESFKEPSPIQSQCWPFLLAKKDVVAIAETGSGKTLGFGFPLISNIFHEFSHNRPQAHQGHKACPRALILAPTRELALQIFETLAAAVNLVRECDGDFSINVACIFGGVSKNDQSRILRSKTQPVSIVVGTPGRVLDFLNEGTIDLVSLEALVFDEADRMLDLGFEPDIRKIMAFAPTKLNRQTLMFSATWPQSIRKLASEYLNDPVTIIIGGDASTAATADDSLVAAVSGGIESLRGCRTVKQHVEVLDDPYLKEKRIVDLLKKYQKGTERIIVFVLYKKEADRVEGSLKRLGFSVGSLHGDKSQVARMQVLADFKSSKISILIATDVAARGLDIPNVKVVFNYTFPLTIEDYVHRIGRTGRAGALGLSYTFFTVYDKAHSGELIQVLKNSGQEVPEELYKFGTTIRKKEHKVYGAHFKELDPSIKPKHMKYDD